MLHPLWEVIFFYRLFNSQTNGLKWLETYMAKNGMHHLQTLWKRKKSHTLIFAEVSKSPPPHQNTVDLWWNDGTYIDLFRCVKSLKCSRFLRFDDIEDSQEHLIVDLITKVQVILYPFIQRFKTMYSTNEYITVDEMLAAFWGICSFRKNMSSKAAKYCIEIFTLCFKRTYYMVNLEVYVWKKKPESYDASNKVREIYEWFNL